MNYLIGQRVRIKDTGQTAVITHVGANRKGERYVSLRGEGVLSAPWYEDEIELVGDRNG